MRSMVVSCKSGSGISSLRDVIFDVASQVKECTGITHSHTLSPTLTHTHTHTHTHSHPHTHTLSPTHTHTLTHPHTHTHTHSPTLTHTLTHTHTHSHPPTHTLSPTHTHTHTHTHAYTHTHTVSGRGIGCGRIPEYRLLMDQLVPASYLQMEDTVRNIALNMRLAGRPPVLSYMELRWVGVSHDTHMSTKYMYIV